MQTLHRCLVALTVRFSVAMLCTLVTWWTSFETVHNSSLRVLYRCTGHKVHHRWVSCIFQAINSKSKWQGRYAMWQLNKDQYSIRCVLHPVQDIPTLVKPHPFIEPRVGRRRYKLFALEGLQRTHSDKDRHSSESLTGANTSCCGLRILVGQNFL